MLGPVPRAGRSHRSQQPDRLRCLVSFARATHFLCVETGKLGTQLVDEILQPSNTIAERDGRCIGVHSLRPAVGNANNMDSIPRDTETVWAVLALHRILRLGFRPASEGPSDELARVLVHRAALVNE